ncbi:MAG: CotH kinase family protein [Flavobacteriales bacterium]|nr:CotH kinase family protein [Flavobacteriales bacterium]
MLLRPDRCLLLTLLALAQPAGAQVVINEVSASNVSGLTDNFGEREDWFELFNTAATPTDISGWWLSDRPTNPQKWQIPAGTVIPANGYLTVFASGRNTSAGGFHHTNFKLSQCDGEHVLLTNTGGVTVDDFEYSFANRTQADHSRGRTTSGAATWSLFLTPTPGAPNAGASAEYMPRPVLTPVAGVYGGSVNVTITGAPAGATIRYTTNGDQPTAASTVYTGPFAVNTTSVVRAAIFSGTAGVPTGFTETNTYLVNVNHTVPIVSIAGDQVDNLLNGNGGIQPPGSFELFAANGTLLDEATGEYNEHGNDSWAYQQRGFDYITRDQFGHNDGIHHPIFRTQNRDHYQRLIIKAAANDNYPFAPGQGAHIRDAYVHALSQIGDLKLDERSFEPCVLYVNGQYWGVYELREKADDSDYTQEYFDQGEYDLQYLKTWGGTWSEYGGPQAQADWNALRNYILANNMGDPVAFAYVDGVYNWKSLVDYFVINSYTVCTDWLNWNTAWWRGLNPAGDGRRWRYVLWDMDATFGHYINYTGVPDDSPDADPCNAEDLPNPGGQGHTEILSKLVAENQEVSDYYVNRYIDMGNSLFSCNTMIPVLDSLIALIAPEMPGQIARWGGSMATWQTNVQALRDFITARCVAIQDGLVDCYDLEGPYNVVFNVNPPLSGQIKINSLTPPTYPYTGVYYGGINTSLEAIASTGYVFSHWTTASGTMLSPSLLDSLVSTEFTLPDTIIAHFIPPIKHDVVVLVDPPGAANVKFGTTLITSFPHVEQVSESVPYDIQVLPEPFFNFLNWEVYYSAFVPADATQPLITVTFLSPDTIIAHLEPEMYGYYVPNAFTPNGDGNNDVWLPLGNAVDPTNYNLQVFDRWGRLIFESKDPRMGWDGTLGGQPSPIGVYVYRAHVVDATTQKVQDLSGHVTLLR